MAMRKIEINEDELRKVILILKLSKAFVRVPSDNLTLLNLWRVSEKLADKLMKKAGLFMTTNKGRTTFKLIEESTPNERVEKLGRTPRCRKRKN